MGVVWIYLAQDRDQRRALLSPLVSYNDLWPLWTDTFQDIQKEKIVFHAARV
jgi:hypothetical protein